MDGCALTGKYEEACTEGGDRGGAAVVGGGVEKEVGVAESCQVLIEGEAVRRNDALRIDAPVDASRRRFCTARPCSPGKRQMLAFGTY